MSKSKVILFRELADDLQKFAAEFRQASRDGIHIRYDRCLTNAERLDKYVKMLRKIRT